MSLNRNNPVSLLQAWQELQAKEPRIYTRDAAAKLGVSEAELIALRCPESAYRLKIDSLTTLLNEAMKFGQVMFIVRNEAAVLEMDGQLVFEAKDHYISGTSKEILLAVSPKQIGSAFSVHAEEWMKRGILFFDEAGDSVLKVYFRDNSKTAEIDEWLGAWKCAEQVQTLKVSSPDKSSATKEGDHHHCNCENSATSIPVEKSYKPLLESATQAGDSVTLSLCNTGCHFSVTAAIKKVAAMGPWFNILDDELHLHLRENAVASASVSSDSPTQSTKLALKDASGKTILRIRVSSESQSAKALLG
ncbi:MAG: hypothetical protein LBV12_12075 [Puniceicoccales bacterium]|jgi:putative hemin transport protein|nr:hypothetical protein [Puniceicoccales bacterium]